MRIPYLIFRFDFIVLTSVIIVLTINGSFSIGNVELDTTNKDSIINKYLKRGAWTHLPGTYRWNSCIDSGLVKDSTIALLWQQKAMPYYKCGKYEIGENLLKNAVKYDSSYLDYYAFMECVFSKRYHIAYIAFQKSEKINCGGVIMDHPYKFYMGLCLLQLNKFDSAKYAFENIIAADMKRNGFTHFLNYYYQGICYYEERNYDSALKCFEKTLIIYDKFPDALYYKAQCYRNKSDKESFFRCLTQAEFDFNLGYSINEDNAIYEPYPYQKYFKRMPKIPEAPK